MEAIQSAENASARHVEATEEVEKISRYEIIDTIGQGAYGRVYACYDPMLDRQVAVKIVINEAPKEICGEMLKRFALEAQVLGRLNHLNVVAVHDAGMEGSRPYLVMELCSGPSLEQLIKVKGSLTAPEAERVLDQMGAALDCVHKAGIVHRDMKPANLVLHLDNWKLTDFGIALSSGRSRMTASGSVIGTPFFMSPEQAKGEVIDSRSDLFSLAVVIYTALAGRPPFVGAPLAVMSQLISKSPPPITSFASHLSPRLNDFFLRAMAMSPEERFQDGKEMVAAFRLAVNDCEVVPEASVLEYNPELGVIQGPPSEVRALDSNYPSKTPTYKDYGDAADDELLSLEPHDVGPPPLPFGSQKPEGALPIPPSSAQGLDAELPLPPSFSPPSFAKGGEAEQPSSPSLVQGSVIEPPQPPTFESDSELLPPPPPLEAIGHLEPRSPERKEASSFPHSPSQMQLESPLLPLGLAGQAGAKKKQYSQVARPAGPSRRRSKKGKGEKRRAIPECPWETDEDKARLRKLKKRKTAAAESAFAPTEDEIRPENFKIGLPKFLPKFLVCGCKKSLALLALGLLLLGGMKLNQDSIAAWAQQRGAQMKVLWGAIVAQPGTSPFHETDSAKAESGSDEKESVSLDERRSRKARAGHGQGSTNKAAGKQSTRRFKSSDSGKSTQKEKSSPRKVASLREKTKPGASAPVTDSGASEKEGTQQKAEPSVWMAMADGQVSESQDSSSDGEVNVPSGLPGEDEAGSEPRLAHGEEALSETGSSPVSMDASKALAPPGSNAALNGAPSGSSIGLLEALRNSGIGGSLRGPSALASLQSNESNGVKAGSEGEKAADDATKESGLEAEGEALLDDIRIEAEGESEADGETMAFARQVEDHGEENAMLPEIHLIPPDEAFAGKLLSLEAEVRPFSEGYVLRAKWRLGGGRWIAASTRAIGVGLFVMEVAPPTGRFSYRFELMDSDGRVVSQMEETLMIRPQPEPDDFSVSMR